MSPVEIELIVARAVEEGLEFPLWLYVATMVAMVACVLLGSYLKKKGENLATKEDYESLLAQIKKTTTATESIKSDLAKGSWLHQQSWYLKEKYYSGLLKELYKLRHSISARTDHYMEPGSEHDDERINVRENYIKQTQIGIKALQAIQELHGPAEMVITNRAIEALDEFYKTDWHAGNFSACNSEYLSEVYTSADKAHRIVLEEARSELK